MIAPTVFGRLNALDLMRGVAILGILLANIWAFGFPISDLFSMAPQPVGTRLEQFLEGAELSFVSGKFRSMLAILFGVGIYLQFRKRVSTHAAWPGGYLKRTFFLGLMGLLHALLIWWGDILFAYAWIAVAACLMVRLSNRILWIVIGCTLAFSFCCGAGMALLAFVPNLGEGANAGFFDTAHEVAVFRDGTYFEQFAFRAVVFLMATFQLLILFPPLLGLFLFGIILARWDVLPAPSAQPIVRNRVLWLSFGIGLPLNLLGFLIGGHEMRTVLSIAWEMLFAPLLAPGYIMLLAVASERGWFAAGQKAVERVGRLALTNYILQSLLCTFVFYSWGLGLFAELERVQAYLVVAAVWIVNLVFSWAWLRRFDIGPLEWALRSLTEGRRLPWRFERPQPVSAFET
jgi:uncharacterized protein